MKTKSYDTNLSTYSVGSILNSFLKHELKYFGSLNPTVYANSDTLMSGFYCIILQAAFNRIFLIKAEVLSPVSDFNLL